MIIFLLLIIAVGVLLLSDIGQTILYYAIRLTGVLLALGVAAVVIVGILAIILD